jgi:hypothetical protein
MAGLEGPTSHQPFVTPADRRALRLRQSSKLASQPEMTLRAARTTTPNNHHSGPSRPGYARRMQQHRLGTAGRDRHAENEVERSRLHRRLMALRLRRTLRLALACPLALEAAFDVPVGLAFGSAAGGLAAGGGVEAQPGQGDVVQGAVELAVAVAVEPVAHGLAR